MKYKHRIDKMVSEMISENKYENIISIGKNKGEWDFGVRATITELSYEEMNELRQMIIVAIGVAEEMWERSRQDSACKISSSFL